MMAWWARLSERERLACALALAFAGVLAFVAVRPLPSRTDAVAAGVDAAPADACEATSTPGPPPSSWVKTCAPDGKRLVTCWAGHRAVVATCARCRVDEDGFPRCDAPEVDLPTLLERDLPLGLARCPGRAKARVRLVVTDADGGHPQRWRIDARAEPPSVRANDDGEVDAEMAIDRAHLVDLLTDVAWDVLRSFFAGRMRIDGGQMEAVQIGSWLVVPWPLARCFDAGG